MLSAQQVEQFKRDGFLRGGKVASDDEIEVLREEMDRVIRDDGKPGIPQPVRITSLSGAAAPVWQIVNIWEASEAYKKLMYTKKLVEEIAQLTNARELRIWHDQIQYKPSGVGGSNMWHQDSPYWPIIKPKDIMVTAWVALDDVDEDNGCMRMVPGSYKWGDQIQYIHTLTDFYQLPAEFDGHKLEARSCPVGKGEVHFHHALTWHGSGHNKSGRPRRAIAFHYMTEQLRYVASGGHPMKPFVEVEDGEVLKGEHFPLVWSRERVVVGSC